MEKKFKKEEVLGFNGCDWVEEISSGYNGYRNINKSLKEYGEWRHYFELNNIVKIQEQYEKDYKLICEFVGYPENEYPKEVIENFLNEKYFKD